MPQLYIIDRIVHKRTRQTLKTDCPEIKSDGGKITLASEVSSALSTVPEKPKKRLNIFKQETLLKNQQSVQNIHLRKCQTHGEGALVSCVLTTASSAASMHAVTFAVTET